MTMTARFTSRNSILTITILIVVVSCLALLSAVAAQGLSERTAAASLLVLCFVVFLVAGALYTGRAILKWQIAEAPAYLIWERGAIIAAILLTVLGLALLEDMLRAAGNSYMAQMGVVTFLIGAVVILIAETTLLSGHDWMNAQVVLYIILAFLAQAAFGVALLQTGLVAGWVAWATIVWNIGWLLFLFIVRPRDIYYPVLHHVAPLMIGIALLAQ